VAGNIRDMITIIIRYLPEGTESKLRTLGSVYLFFRLRFHGDMSACNLNVFPWSVVMREMCVFMALDVCTARIYI
jgi:hypothetical protein